MKMEFIINNTKLKLDDKNNLYYWFDKSGNRKIKNPYWKIKNIHIGNGGYKRCKINKKMYLFHRLVYYAHNQDWNIYDSSRNNIIDHINRKKKENHISNLRIANNSLNMLNKNTKGYCIIPNGKFRVFFRSKGYGIFDTKEEAQQKYLELKKEYLRKNNIII